MSRFVFLFMVLIYSVSTQADDLSQAYQKGQEVAASHSNELQALLKNLDKAQFPHYPTNVPEQQYYSAASSVENLLKSAAQSAASHNEVADVINNGLAKRPFFQINNQEAAMQKLHHIADAGNAIMHGHSTELVRCRLKPKHCDYQWQQKTCFTSRSEAPLLASKKADYQESSQSVSDCASLMQAGCAQIASVCIQQDKTQCQRYQQTYQCPVNHCTDNQLICGNRAFCLEGECSSTNYEPVATTVFKQAATALTAAVHAAQSVDSDNQLVFNGELLTCSNAIAGVKNCCRNSGWGIDINLTHCTDSEKRLGQAKQNKQVVATGDLCAQRKEWPGGSLCVSTQQTYCVFQSKLARIVQEQGRQQQLNISFGQGKQSNCAGITPAQLQLIDFAAIDFTEFFQDLHNKLKLPDAEQTKAAISTRFKTFDWQGGRNE